MHTLPDGWRFDGNLESPTFTPSFLHRGLKTVWKGCEWTGEWRRDEKGNTIPRVCHYNLTAGMIHFHIDSTHPLAGKVVPLPELPVSVRETIKA
jgi:hypothetical protein